MTSEGGTKSSFSPFLIFLRATRPLSPTSTLCIAIFCSGKPDWYSHFCSKAAFSRESTSQPQLISWVLEVSFVVEIEENWTVMTLLYFLLNFLWKFGWSVLPNPRDDGLGSWEKVGMNEVLVRTIEASAIVEKEEERKENLIWDGGNGWQDDVIENEFMIIVLYVSILFKFVLSRSTQNIEEIIFVPKGFWVNCFAPSIFLWKISFRGI